MLSFSIIIVSWNALDHLKTYLPGVAQTEYEDFEILLADNASGDGSVEWVEQEFPGIRILKLDRNYGYCGGNNRGAAHASGDVLLFLNNDVRVESDWLTHLARCFEGKPGTAVFQPKILSDKRPERFEYAGAAGGFLDRYGFPFCRGRVFDTIEEDRGQYDDDADLFWASGAAFAIRRSVFLDSGGFDESFEFHMEEIDLCWRLWNRGYKTSFCPLSRVYHLGGGSLPMGSPRKIYYNYRNNLSMIWKNCSRNTLAHRFVTRYFLDFISAIRALIKGRFGEFFAIIRAHAHFWRSFPQLRETRKKLEKERTVSTDPAVLLQVNLVVDYFWKKKQTFRELI